MKCLAKKRIKLCSNCKHAATTRELESSPCHDCVWFSHWKFGGRDYIGEYVELRWKWPWLIKNISYPRKLMTVKTLEAECQFPHEFFLDNMSELKELGIMWTTTNDTETVTWVRTKEMEEWRIAKRKLMKEGRP